MKLQREIQEKYTLCRVCFSQFKGRNMQGWVAKSVARQLATAVLWVRIQTSLKNQKNQKS
jgi:hypothetical protein